MLKEQIVLLHLEQMAESEMDGGHGLVSIMAMSWWLDLMVIESLRLDMPTGII